MGTKDMVESLKAYFKNTPREKVLEDWSATGEFDGIGPTVEEFIIHTQKHSVFFNINCKLRDIRNKILETGEVEGNPEECYKLFTDSVKPMIKLIDELIAQNAFFELKKEFERFKALVSDISELINDIGYAERLKKDTEMMNLFQLLEKI